MPFLLRKSLIFCICYFSTRHMNRIEKNGDGKNLTRVKVNKKDISLFELCKFLSKIHKRI